MVLAMRWMLLAAAALTAQGYSIGGRLGAKPATGLKSALMRRSFPLRRDTVQTQATTAAPAIETPSVRGLSGTVNVARQAMADMKPSTFMLNSAALAGGGVLTYVLNNWVGWGPIAGCGATALLAGALLPAQQAAAAFLGTCPGMAQTGVIATAAGCAFLALISGITRELFDRKGWFLGVGGRIGLLAQFTCTAYFMAKTHLVEGGMKVVAGGTDAAFTGGPGGLWSPAIADATMASMKTALPTLVVYSILGAFAMRIWKKAFSTSPNRLGNNFAAAGATGFAAGMLLPPLAAAPSLAGAFVAMSAPTVIQNRLALVLAAGLAGVSQFFLTPVLVGGWSGKLGTNALIGVLAYKVFSKIITKMTPKAQADASDEAKVEIVIKQKSA